MELKTSVIGIDDELKSIADEFIPFLMMNCER
jgi:hypothetical protein